MNDQADAQRRLIEADDERCRAMLANDLDALGRVLGDDVIYTHSSAVVDDKEAYLHSLRQGLTRYLSLDRQEMHIRLYGQMPEPGYWAIMHGHVVMQIQVQGKQKDLNSRFQSVWVERDGRWQMVSWASILIPSTVKIL